MVESITNPKIINNFELASKIIKFQRHILNLLGISIPKGIKIVTVDFTLSSKDSVILDKTEKHYQSKDRFLFIVVYGTKNPDTINHLNKLVKEEGKTNVKVLSLNDYIKLLGIDKAKIYKDFKDLENRISKAFSSDVGFNKFIELGRRWDTQLNSLSYTRSQFINSFKGYLGKFP